MNQKHFVEVLKYVPLAGFCFWLPDILLHWLRGHRYSGLDVLVLTALLPITTALVLAIIWERSQNIENRQPTALSALVGIWLFGPLMMFVAESFTGGGFSKPGGWQFVLKGTIFFPVVTFMMSTYDGTLGAVLLTSGLLPFLPTLCSLINRRPKEGGAISNPRVNQL